MSMYGERSCWSIGGEPLDTLVATEVLRSFAPPAMQAVLEAGNESNAGYEAVTRQREAELERARHGARLLKEHVEQVDPRNHLAAAELHKDLQATLLKVQELERAQRETPVDPALALTPESLEAIRRLGADLPALWEDPATTPQDRKALVRLLVQEIQVVTVSETGWEVDIRWRGGAVTHHALIRPWADGRRARVLEAHGCTHAEIAEILSREGFRTWHGGKLYTPRPVRRLLFTQKWKVRRAREAEQRKACSAVLPQENDDFSTSGQPHAVAQVCQRRELALIRK